MEKKPNHRHRTSVRNGLFSVEKEKIDNSRKKKKEREKTRSNININFATRRRGSGGGRTNNTRFTHTATATNYDNIDNNKKKNNLSQRRQMSRKNEARFVQIRENVLRRRADPNGGEARRRRRRLRRRSITILLTFRLCGNVIVKQSEEYGREKKLQLLLLNIPPTKHCNVIKYIILCFRPMPPRLRPHLSDLHF